MSRSVAAKLKAIVRKNYQDRCAYCQSEERLVAVTFEIEHILPIAAGGESVRENLCLSCPMCNRYKGSRQEAADPETGSIHTLFHPRRDSWATHFAWDVPCLRLIGLTPCGRATVGALRCNRDLAVRVRGHWIELGLHPPKR